MRSSEGNQLAPSAATARVHGTLAERCELTKSGKALGFVGPVNTSEAPW